MLLNRRARVLTEARSCAGLVYPSAVFTVDPFVVASVCNVTVFETDDLQTSGCAGSYVGALYRGDAGDVELYVSSMLSLADARFVCAYLLGIHQLGVDKDKVLVQLASTVSFSDVVRLTDEGLFAAALLMNPILTYSKFTTGATPAVVAERFNVPLPVVSSYLARLGLYSTV